MDSASPDGRDEWPAAARVAAFVYLGRLALGWAEPLGAEELVLDAAIWWALFGVGFGLMPTRPDIWVRLHISVGMSFAAFLSFAGLSLAEAAAAFVVALGLTLVGLGRDVGPPGTAGIAYVLAVPVGLVLLVRGAPDGMVGIAVLAILVLLAGHRDLRVAAVLSLGAALVGMPERPPSWRATGPVPDGPDIVLVVADTLRADAAAEMRTVRRLTSGGAVSLHAVSSAPWTLPAMGTLMTGEPPSVHGAGMREDGVARLAPGHSTLARDLTAHGYDTAAVLAENGYLARRFGLLDGLAEVRGGIGRGSELVMRLDERARRVLSRALRDLGVPIGLWGHGWGVDDAVQDVRTVMSERRDRPVFLWVHLMETHMPWEHADRDEAALRREWVLADPAWAEDPEALRTAYRAEVQALDDGLLELLAVLGPPPERGRVLVLTSDHGEELFEHGGFEHGHALWEELLRVPLVIQGQAIHPTARVNRVGHADLYATLRAAAGLEPRGGRPLQGSIGPSVHTAQGLLYGAHRDGYAVYRGPNKLVVRGAPRLYDVHDDPTEERDLAEERPDLVQSLEAFAPAAGAHGPAVHLAEEERARLEALGYHLPE